MVQIDGTIKSMSSKVDASGDTIRKLILELDPNNTAWNALDCLQGKTIKITIESIG